MSRASEPIRALMLNYEFPPVGGGTGAACQQLLEAFAERSDARFDLVTSGPGDHPTVEHAYGGTTIHRLPVGKRNPDFWRSTELLRWTWRAYGLAKRLIRDQGFDLCHCWAGWPPGLLGYAFRSSIPYLVSLRGSDVPGYSERLAALDPLVFRRLSTMVWTEAGAVVAVSDSLRALALRTCPDLDVQVIPNAADTVRFIPGSTVAPFTVLFVGRLIPRKRVEDLLTAFRDVLKRIPSARLVIAGDGPEGPRLESLAGTMALGEAVRFTGHVPREALPDLYRGASVFVLPSEREGMPNAQLEAMASGLPVVTTVAAPALLDGNGVGVRVGHPSEISEALIRYGLDAALRHMHGRRSRELAESTTWSAVAEWYLGVYWSVIDRARIDRTP
ncbi:MAG TPA: glycosyltransferase family 4 protein [Longimicrobiales bacterium]|nr:glycosyltransferase family 4 protein [Longimicrobiales bacterium]